MRKIRFRMERQRITLGEALTRYLARLDPSEKEAVIQDLNSFVRWYGWDLPLERLSPSQIDDYARRVLENRKLEPVKAFLSFAWKEKLTPVNLSTHIKTKKTAAKNMSQSNVAQEKTLTLTFEGYSRFKAELEKLNQEKVRLVEEVRRARADKDFRENAPLQAAQEQLSRVESRIRELESMLSKATIVQEKVEKPKIDLGARVTLRDLGSGEQANYCLVHPQEVDPAQGKISVASPLGKALVGHQEGEEIEVTVPAGVRRYLIEKVEFL